MDWMTTITQTGMETETDTQETTTEVGQTTTQETIPEWTLPYTNDPFSGLEPLIPLEIVFHSVPLGVLQTVDGESAKKRCRCIEKKRRKVVKVIKYIPLSPLIQFGGNKRNFTCKCSHLRKVVKRTRTSTTKLF